MSLSLATATAVKQISSHTYTADFDPAWTIGQVPHGGYVTAVFQRVAYTHFSTTLSTQNQPHTLSLHLDFLRRTQTGLATFTIRDVKLGRQTSVIHIMLSQDSREEVVGYITHSNLAAEAGVSFPTAWKLNPPAPQADVSKFATDQDPLWGERKEWPFSDFRKATRQVRSFFPRAGQQTPGVIDEWLCLRNGENWTNEAVGSVVDTFPQVLETFILGEDPYSIELEQRGEEARVLREKGGPGFWYPTLLLNLDVKKVLPKEGVRWLFVRLQTKVIKNGRFDLEIVVQDIEGDVVALSHHVCFALSAERNLAKRRKLEGSKL